MSYFLILLSFFVLTINQLRAEDLRINIMGADQEEDLISKVKSSEVSPYVIENTESSPIENMKIESQSHAVLNSGNDEIEKMNKKPFQEYKENGYTLPGSFENSENYLELDKKKYTQDLHKAGTSAWNITYLHDSYRYDSPNNIIANTISQGYRHVQAGFITIRSDRYLFKSIVGNLYWSMGSGISYNYGYGIFSKNNQQSDTAFRLWEVPFDLGIGVDIPIYKWFKISATAGPSALGLLQNRDDLNGSNPHKNKIQVGVGEFASLLFKISVPGFNSDNAYELYTTSGITNMFLTLESRYHNYSHYLDSIKISGTSIGGGVTFEFL